LLKNGAHERICSMEKVCSSCSTEYLRALGRVLIIILALGTGQYARAQNASQPELSLPASSATQYLHNYQAILKAAQKQRWPIKIGLGANRSLSLQRIDALGQPVYYTTHNAPLAAGTHTAALYEGGGLGLTLSGNSPAVQGKIA